MPEKRVFRWHPSSETNHFIFQSEPFYPRDPRQTILSFKVNHFIQDVQDKPFCLSKGTILSRRSKINYSIFQSKLFYLSKRKVSDAWKRVFRWHPTTSETNHFIFQYKLEPNLLLRQRAQHRTHMVMLIWIRLRPTAVCTILQYMASLDICHRIFTDSGYVLNMGMGITLTHD